MNWGTFFAEIIKKFDIMKMVYSVFFVLLFMVVPYINFLNFIMPPDSLEKWIYFAIWVLVNYSVISMFARLIKKYKKIRSQKLDLKNLTDIERYFIIEFYSIELKEFSISSRILDNRFKENMHAVDKLCKRNILNPVALTSYTYKLSHKAVIILNKQKWKKMILKGKSIG